MQKLNKHGLPIIGTTQKKDKMYICSVRGCTNIGEMKTMEGKLYCIDCYARILNWKNVI